MLDSETLKAAFERGEIAECIVGDDPAHQLIDRDWGEHEIGAVVERLVAWAKQADRAPAAVRGIEVSLDTLISRGEMDRVVALLSSFYHLEPHQRLPVKVDPAVEALTSWVRGDAPLDIDLLLVAENLPPLRDALEEHHRRSLEELFRRVVFETPANAHLRVPMMLGLLVADSPIVARLAKLIR